jgi:hypothetical protein
MGQLVKNCAKNLKMPISLQWMTRKKLSLKRNSQTSNISPNPPKKSHPCPSKSQSQKKTQKLSVN